MCDIGFVIICKFDNYFDKIAIIDNFILFGHINYLFMDLFLTRWQTCC